MFERWTQMMKFRLGLGLVVAFCVCLFMGFHETWLCIRTIFGPSTITYSQMTTEGLGDYGYVKITGIKPNLEGAMVSRSLSGNIDVGMGVDPGPEETVGGSKRVVLLAHGSDTQEALKDIVSATEVTGFVDTTAEYYNGPLGPTTMKNLGRAREEDVWVLDVKRPSWLKAILLIGIPFALVAGGIAYLMKKPLVD